VCLVSGQEFSRSLCGQAISLLSWESQFGLLRLARLALPGQTRRGNLVKEPSMPLAIDQRQNMSYKKMAKYVVLLEHLQEFPKSPPNSWFLEN